MSDRILKVRWSKKENDLLITYPRRCDGALMNYLFGDILRWAGIDGKEISIKEAEELMNKKVILIKS